MVASGCVFDTTESVTSGVTVTTDLCEVSGAGTLPSGETGSGTIRGADTGALGTWEHTSSSGTVLGTPDWVLCRINGALLADFAGPATIDGASGYSYRVSVQDRGTSGVATIETLTATLHYRPTWWDDGTLPIAGHAEVTIPAELPVTEGQPGTGMAVLSFDLADSGDTIRCRYRGNGRAAAGGDAYVLRHCVGRHGRAPIVAGDVVDVTAMTLHVQNGAARCRIPLTTVSVDLEVTGAPDRDFYRIVVWDSSSAQVLLSEGVLASGDFTVTDLTP